MTYLFLYDVVCTFMATSVITANLLYNSEFGNSYEYDFPSSDWYESSDKLAWPMFAMAAIYIAKMYVQLGG